MNESLIKCFKDFGVNNKSVFQRIQDGLLNGVMRIEDICRVGFLGD